MPKGEGRHPNRNEAVLAEGKTEVGVGDNLKEEIPVAAFVYHLVSGKGTQRKPTQHKGSGVEGKFLGAPRTLFPNTLDKLKLLELVFGDAD